MKFVKNTKFSGNGKKNLERFLLYESQLEKLIDS